MEQGRGSRTSSNSINSIIDSSPPSAMSFITVRSSLVIRLCFPVRAKRARGDAIEYVCVCVCVRGGGGGQHCHGRATHGCAQWGQCTTRDHTHVLQKHGTGARTLHKVEHTQQERLLHTLSVAAVPFTPCRPCRWLEHVRCKRVCEHRKHLGHASFAFAAVHGTAAVCRTPTEKIELYKAHAKVPVGNNNG
jgi:hypothetical protein